MTSRRTRPRGTTALTSPLLKEKALKPGDEVITCATGFPTTLNPSILYGMTPVFVDVDIPTYNVDVAGLEAAIGAALDRIDAELGGLDSRGRVDVRFIGSSLLVRGRGVDPTRN